MRAVEEKVGIAPERADDFRRELMNQIGALAVDGKRFDYRSDDRLRRALELKLFEDQKDSINLSNLVAQVMDEETRQKIDVIRDRLIKLHGYCEVCSTDALEYIASVFARGELAEEEGS